MMSKKIISLLLALLMLVGLLSVSAFAAESEAETQTEEVALDGAEVETPAAEPEAEGDVEGDGTDGAAPEETPAAEVPVITTQPASATYTVGDTAEALTVEASVSDGGTLSYQWYWSLGIAQTDWWSIDGAVESSYTPSTESTGTYYCKVTNTLTVDGVDYTASVNTAYAKIEVNADKPVITLGTGDAVTVKVSQIAAGYDIPVYIKATDGVSSYSLVSSFTNIAWAAMNNAGVNGDNAPETKYNKYNYTPFSGAWFSTNVTWSGDAVDSTEPLFYIHLEQADVAEGTYTFSFSTAALVGSKVNGTTPVAASLTINVVADGSAVVTGLLGDANGDGTVDVNDATLALQYYVGAVDSSKLDLKLGNVNGDGSVDVNDATAILQYYVTGSSSYPIGKPVE